MKSFDNTWEEIHAKQEWGKYPSESVVRFVARNYYNTDRKLVKILDFCCGAGSNTWYLAREGFDVYAFDGSKSAIKRCEQRLKLENLNAKLCVRDALDLDYGENYFDCIIDNVSIYSNIVNDIKKMYMQIYKFLKKGGKMFSTMFSTETTGYGNGIKLEEGTYENIEIGSLAGRGRVHFFEKQEIIKILEIIGFKNIVVDILYFTDRGCVIEQFLVQAEK